MVSSLSTKKLDKSKKIFLLTQMMVKSSNSDGKCVLESFLKSNFRKQNFSLSFSLVFPVFHFPAAACRCVSFVVFLFHPTYFSISYIQEKMKINEVFYILFLFHNLSPSALRICCCFESHNCFSLPCGMSFIADFNKLNFH